jgi:hypothetical protein
MEKGAFLIWTSNIGRKRKIQHYDDASTTFQHLLQLVVVQFEIHRGSAPLLSVGNCRHGKANVVVNTWKKEGRASEQCAHCGMIFTVKAEFRNPFCDPLIGSSLLSMSFCAIRDPACC